MSVCTAQGVCGGVCLSVCHSLGKSKSIWKALHERGAALHPSPELLRQELHALRVTTENSSQARGVNAGHLVL